MGDCKQINCLINPAKKHDVIGDNRWENMHERYVREAQCSEIEVLFIGDSIIQQLQLTSLWNEKINSLHCLNFGIGGDRVENVLWRVLNGELNFSCSPKAIVLFVGTNNIECTAQEVFDGICQIIEVITKRLRDAYIILPTLLPRGQHPNLNRERNMLVNELCMNNFDSAVVKGKVANPNIHIVPIHEDIVQSDGTISHYVMHDYLHLTNQGYNKIFKPVYQKLCNLLNKPL